MLEIHELSSLLFQLQRGNNGFVHTRGGKFILSGKNFNFNGFNAYWMMLVASGTTKQDYNVASVMQQASKHGLTVGRTWAFSDGGSSPLQISPGNYNENMFKGLDIVIAEAQKNGIRLILSMVNNYADFGGRKQYVQWAKERGQKINSEDDFYTNKLVKNFYKNHVKKILTRVNTITKVAYKDDPTIFAWELINEPRCQSDTSGKTFQSWVREMASYIKNIDRNHMVEIGAEGFYGPSTPEKLSENPHNAFYGTDFVADNQIRGIDFATIHAYPDIWFEGSSVQSQLNYLQNFCQSHIDTTSKYLKKPLVIAEFGKSLKNSGVSQRNTLLSKVYDSIYKSAKVGGVFHGGLVWQLLNGGMSNLHDGYQIVLASDPSTANIVNQQSRRMNALK